MWPELAAILLSLVGLAVTAYNTPEPNKKASYGNWIVIAGLVLQLIIVGLRGAERCHAPAIVEHSPVDRSCDPAQIKSLSDMEFITTRTTKGSLRNKLNVTSLDEKKVDARLKTLSELVLCLNQRLQPDNGNTNAAPPPAATSPTPPPP